MANGWTGSRLDYQTLVDLLIDYAYSGAKLDVLAKAYGISTTEISRKAHRYGLRRRPKRRNIRSHTESSGLSRREMV